MSLNCGRAVSCFGYFLFLKQSDFYYFAILIYYFLEGISYFLAIYIRRVDIYCTLREVEYIFQSVDEISMYLYDIRENNPKIE